MIDSRGLAKAARKHILRMVHCAKSSHVGSCLSVADILAVLYSGVLRIDPDRPGDPGRDRLLFSKGHAAAALYAVLAERGFFPGKWLDSYCADGCALVGHVTHHGIPGVEASFGSLGHGLPIGCGMALALLADGSPARVFVVLGDGECDEGSIWEAALFASHHGLGNLTAIVDVNGLQGFGTTEQVLSLTPLTAKWQAFGWTVRNVSGHDHHDLASALGAVPFKTGRPSLVLADTVKGKGVDYMEGELAWHYKSPDNKQLAEALRQLERDG